MLATEEISSVIVQLSHDFSSTSTDLSLTSSIWHLIAIEIVVEIGLIFLCFVFLSLSNFLQQSVSSNDFIGGVSSEFLNRHAPATLVLSNLLVFPY